MCHGHPAHSCYECIHSYGVWGINCLLSICSFYIYICMYAFWFPSIGWRRTVAAIIHSCTCFLTCSSNSGGWEASTRWVRSVGRRVLWLSTPPMYNPHLQRKSEHSGSYIVEEKAPNAEETFCSNKVFSLIAVDMRVWVCTSGVATHSASTLHPLTHLTGWEVNI